MSITHAQPVSIWDMAETLITDVSAFFMFIILSCSFEHRFQFFFCNLSRGSFREFFYLPEFPRDFEEREVLLQVFFQLARVDGKSRLHAVIAASRLSAKAVLDGDDRGFVDAGVGVEQLLDLSGVDILAHADDHVLEPVHDIDVTVLVDAGYISRVQPAVFQRFGGRFGLAEIAVHDVGPLHQKFARFSRGHIMPVCVHETEPLVRDSGTDGTEARGFRRVHRDDGRRFRKSVPFDNRHFEFRAERFADGQRKRRASQHDKTERFHVVRRRQFCQKGANRRHHDDDGDFVCADQFDRFFRGKRVLHGDGGAGVEFVQNGAGPCETVVHRQYAENVVFARQPDDLLQRDCVHDEIAVRKDRAFRQAGCSRSVDNRAGFVRAEVLWKRGGGSGTHGFCAFGHQDRLHVVVLVCAERGFEVERLIGNDIMDVGIFQYERRLPHAELKIDGDDYRAEGRDSHIGDDVLGAVVRVYSDAVVDTNAVGVEARTTERHGQDQGAIGHRAPLIVDGNILRVSAPNEIVNEHRQHLSLGNSAETAARILLMLFIITESDGKKL